MSTRRSYFYHLKFELYSSIPPTPVTTSPSTSHKKSSKGKKHHLAAKKDIWLPPPRTNIFENLPVHSRHTIISPRLRPESEPCASESEKTTTSTVIDCGAAADSHNHPTKPEGLATNKNTSKQPALTTGENPKVARQDWRFGAVRVESIDMSASRGKLNVSTGLGPRSSLPATSRNNVTKARFEKLAGGEGTTNTELGWGVVHLYRDEEETLGLGSAPRSSTTVSGFSGGNGESSAAGSMQEDVGDTTIICIPAVPSYMTPSDFLGWIGETTREEVSHFRMIMTERMNRYMVLMKFRDGEIARKWRQEWDGKVFNGMEPENCHVMFIKSITFETPTRPTEETFFPDMSHDPFTPALAATSPTASLALKPLPPPTASLVELPTCPVCLERMDDTTGLLTIPCQHVFHCACLQKWRGSGCPVCRHIQPSSDLALSTPFGAGASDLCTVCDCTEDLWICLICGNNGCGRYKGGHAKEHWTESGHNYALEIETQHVWDYASDGWVHRLIQTKGDGKLVELPSESRPYGFGNDSGQHHREGQEDMVPAAKLERSAEEFAHLLTSQLDSQRVYFEAMVKNSADKASASAKAADAAAARAEQAVSQLSALTLEHKKLHNDVVPSLERERDRMAAKAEKTSEIARKMTQSFQEEKQVGKGLMERIEHVNAEMAKLANEMKKLKDENEELKEYNRDLQAYFSAGEKLKSLEGTELGEEIKEGSAIAGASKGEGKRKGKGKK